MKKKITLLLTALMLWTIMIPAFASVGLKPEEQYGIPVKFQSNQAYPGAIKIDGVFVYKDAKEYVFTILYSNGELAKLDNQGAKTVKSSFFNPPSGDKLEISWLNNFSRITSDNKKIQYRTDMEKLLQCRQITVFLYDILYNNDDQNISCYFNIADINFDKVPSVQDLLNGYEFSAEKIIVQLEDTPDASALKSIEELKLSEVFRDSAFSSYKTGITRERFAYLMVRFYEKLTGAEIQVNDSVSFTDTDDIYAMKAAQIGITNGIGNNRFGPDSLLNREQMATFVIRTLELAKIDLAYNKELVEYVDDGEISNWSRDAIYTALHFNILNGVGGNKFSPKTVATNEQALVITYRLMKKYGDLKWYVEKDRTRFYLKFEGRLYNIPFAEDVILDGEPVNKDIYFKSFDDMNTFLNLSHLESSRLSYEPTGNPNFAGILKVYDYNYVSIKVESLYFGVDKTGEITKILFNSSFDKAPDLSIIVDKNKDITSYNGFKPINYYDKSQVRNRIHVIPVKEIFEDLGMDYTIEYNSSWNIYVIDFTKS